MSKKTQRHLQFLTFLHSKQSKLADLIEGVSKLHTLLKNAQGPSKPFCFKLKFYIEFDAQELIFQLERVEKSPSQSHIIVVRYALAVQYSNAVWKITTGNIETFGKCPQEGFWKDRNCTDSVYLRQGWGTLMFHVASWAASLLELQRDMTLVHPGSQTMADNYVEENKELEKKFKIINETDYMTFLPSKELTEYAYQKVLNSIEASSGKFCAPVSPYLLSFED